MPDGRAKGMAMAKRKHGGRHKNVLCPNCGKTVNYAGEHLIRVGQLGTDWTCKNKNRVKYEAMGE